MNRDTRLIICITLLLLLCGPVSFVEGSPFIASLSILIGGIVVLTVAYMIPGRETLKSFQIGALLFMAFVTLLYVAMSFLFAVKLSGFAFNPQVVTIIVGMWVGGIAGKILSLALE